MPQVLKNENTTQDTSQLKLRIEVEKLQIVLHYPIHFFDKNQFKSNRNNSYLLLSVNAVRSVNSHGLCNEKGLPFLNLKESQWNVRKTDDQNFSMEREAL